MTENFSHFKRISTVLIWSEDFRLLADWYEEKFEFLEVEELNHPQDTGVLFEVGDVYLWIGQHDKVKGKNKDSYRHMFNISVDSVTAAYEYLKAKGVEFLAEPFPSPVDPELYFATLYDLDKNVVQIVGSK